MKRILVVVLAIGTALPADAQVRRRVPRVPEPSLWGSLSVGLLNANDVSDGNTGSTWDFGRASTPQYRGSLEMAVGRNASIGAAATFAHVPFVYRATNVPDNLPAGNTCTRCDAHLDVVSAGASFHYGGGAGLHQVIEASAGVLQFRNLKQDGGNALRPVDGNVDPYFTFGYGFGYSFSPSMQLSVVQDFGLALHESDNLTSDQSNTLRQRTIRLNFRYGSGNRIRGKP